VLERCEHIHGECLAIYPNIDKLGNFLLEGHVSLDQDTTLRPVFKGHVL
jgi:hypothetical protein